MVVYFGIRFKALLLVVLACIAGLHQLSAQSTKEDSLRKAYYAAPTNPKAYSPLFNYWKKEKKDSAEWLAGEIAKAGKLKKDSLLIADSYSYSGIMAYGKNNFDEAIRLYKLAFDYYGNGKDTTHIRRIANTHFNIGKAYSGSSSSRLAAQEYGKASELFLNLHDTIQAINQLIVMGDDIRLTGDLNRAIEVLLQAQSLSIKINAAEQEARAYNNIANVYMGMDDTAQAKLFYRKSLAIKLKLGNKRDIANTYGNIGTVFLVGNKHIDSALYYFEKSLPLKLEVKDMRGAASTYNNIGRAYIELNRLPEAEKAIMQGLKIREDEKDNTGIAASYSALGKLCLKKKEFSQSIRYFEQSLDIYKASGNLKKYNDILQELATANNAAGNYQIAYQYLDRFAIMRDSLLNLDRSKEIAELQSIYDAEERDAKISRLQQEKLNDELKYTADEERRRKQLYIVIAGALLALLMTGFFIFRHFENQKSKKQLQAAFNEIEYKNKSITDSIRYAQRIQLSILPDQIEFKKIFPDSFVLYKPKDIVSGDFWWAAYVSPTMKAFAIADCTGHGVPGAFMSVMGSGLLNQAAKDKNVRDPAAALQYIDEGVRRQLKQTSSEEEAVQSHTEGSNAQDGMDIALFQFDKDSLQAQFSGAMRNLLLVRNGIATEIAASRFSLGGSVSAEKSFINHDIQLIKGDMLYVSTDGFADQFGGPEGKKFKSSKLKELLISISALPASEQEKILEKTFTEWKGNLEQVDDVCVAGIRV